MKTKKKIIIWASITAFLGLLLGAYLALIYVPSWYQPEYVEPVHEQKIRDDFTAISTRFNNGMQHPRPFEFTISAKDINRFISGMEYLDPRLKNVIPQNVNDPAVQLENDYLKIGAVVEQDGKKAFASFWLKVTPLGRWLMIDDLSAKIGLYPVPRDMMKKQIEKLSGKLSKYLPGLEQILESGHIPNRFKYPNSNYDFTVTQLRADKGILYVTVEPIPKEK